MGVSDEGETAIDEGAASGAGLLAADNDFTQSSLKRAFEENASKPIGFEAALSDAAPLFGALWARAEKEWTEGTIADQLTWGSWVPYAEMTPYVDWWERASRPYGPSGENAARELSVSLAPPLTIMPS